MAEEADPTAGRRERTVGRDLFSIWVAISGLFCTLIFLLNAEDAAQESEPNYLIVTASYMASALLLVTLPFVAFWTAKQVPFMYALRVVAAVPCAYLAALVSVKWATWPISGIEDFAFIFLFSSMPTTFGFALLFFKRR